MTVKCGSAAGCTNGRGDSADAPTRVTDGGMVDSDYRGRA